MFFIVNKTKNELQISDIRVSLGPRQAIDLDKIIDRSKSDKSRDLDLAIKKGIIQVKQKTPTGTPIIITNNDSSEKIDDMRNYLSEEIKNQFQALKIELSSKQLGNNENSSDLTQILDQLKGLANNNPNSIGKSVDEEVIIDDDKLSNIHARSIDRKLKNVESTEVRYDKKEVKDDLEDNISELEDLL